MTETLVTVDGPAGSGKTTLGRRVAAALGVRLIDTGLFYRAVMVAAVREGIDSGDERRAAELAARIRIEVNTDPTASDEDWSVRVDGVDAGELARDPRRATLLAELSALPAVRAAILDRQRALAAGGAVAVGRDCGTVVFPWAPVKLWLWASPEVRALRRAEQLAAAGVQVDARELEGEIAGRDALDASREVAPLRPASDAHMIDTGLLDIDAMVTCALELCREAGLTAAASGEER
jgi:cytidylate kinase